MKRRLELVGHPFGLDWQAFGDCWLHGMHQHGTILFTKAKQSKATQSNAKPKPKPKTKQSTPTLPNCQERSPRVQLIRDTQPEDGGLVPESL